MLNAVHFAHGQESEPVREESKRNEMGETRWEGGGKGVKLH